MAIQARLEGGPRDGEELELAEEKDSFFMEERHLSITEAMVVPDFYDRVDVFQYVLRDRKPDGTLIYRYSGR